MHNCEAIRGKQLLGKDKGSRKPEKARSRKAIETERTIIINLKKARRIDICPNSSVNIHI